MLRAVNNPTSTSSATHRRRLARAEGASYDFERVFREAAGTGVALEIDCDPARMDLSPEHARLALELGCNFSLDADAHAPAEFAYVPMGAWMARRAGIPMERNLNFKPLEGLTMIESDVKLLCGEGDHGPLHRRDVRAARPGLGTDRDAGQLDRDRACLEWMQRHTPMAGVRPARFR